MTHVERFRAVMSFQPVDRLPRIEWATWWDKTIERWKTEGLPPALGSTFDIAQHFGLDPYWQIWIGPRAGTFPPAPHHGAGHVATADDYERLKPHLYPPTEWAADAVRPWGERQARGEVVVWLTLEGFFWFPRGLFGIEPHFYAFYDHPELMHRMNQDLVDHHLQILRGLAPVCRPTFMTFAEDMSYNHGPMLSRELFYEFLAPYYRQVTPVLDELGIIPIVDTDGDVTAMAPWLLDVGVRGVLPLERQAGVDGGKLRAAFPSFLMIGHYDKMVMTHGEEAMRREFDRLLPTMKTGGFIPSVDHQTPPGVSLAEYRVYLRLLEEYAQRGAPGASLPRVSAPAGG
jgi:hypothetical protein